MWVVDDRDDYLWATTVITSRAFPSRLVSQIGEKGVNPVDIPSDDPSGPSSASDPVLIPVLDMLNHKPNHPVTWLISDNGIQFIPEIEVGANEEVFNNYGYKGNEECTLHPKNPPPPTADAPCRARLTSVDESVNGLRLLRRKQPT